MHTTLENLCTALDSLAQVVLGATTENRTLNEVFTWQAPALTRQDLAGLPSILAGRIRDTNLDQITPALDAELSLVPAKLNLLHANTVPQMFTSNCPTAVPAYMATIEWLNTLMEPLLGWNVVADNKAMPAKLSARLKGIQAGIEGIAPDMLQLQTQITTIRDAYETADALPTTLIELKSAQEVINKTTKEATEKLGQIDVRVSEANGAALQLRSQEEEAKKIIDQCLEAYRIATSTGLAGAFDDRAKRLSTSVWGWVIGLLAALSVGVYIGALRFQAMESVLTAREPSWGQIWMQIALSILGIAAPVWFAWLATKQISQRFRLSEDYAFKASVAKAYEGYRREAARIDPAFEAQLFSSALTRLDEAPLRLVDNDNYGSPLHELMNSKVFVKAMETRAFVVRLYTKGKIKERPLMQAAPLEPEPASEEQPKAV